MSEEFKSPWEQEVAFAEKPRDQPYGYVLRGKLVACSREELVRRCGSQDIPQIHLAWHPDAPRIVPVTQVPFLFEAVKDRAKGNLKASLWIGLINLFLFSMLTVVAWGNAQQFVFFLLLAAMVGIVPMVQSVRRLRALKLAQWSSLDRRMSLHQYAAWVASRPMRFTWVILGCLVVVGVLQLITGPENSVRAAGLDKSAVRHGQWWRLLTGPLLHAGMLHLIFNGSALIGLGRAMEVLTSRYHLAVTFLVAALAGSVASLCLLPHTTSVGASGGLLGLIGFLLVLGYRRKTHLPPGFGRSVMINVGIIAAMGALAYSIIDNAAHLGGFLAGVASGWVLIKRGDPVLPLRYGTGLRIAGTLAMWIIVGFAGIASYRILAR